jgi:hypothetical protein
MKKVIVKRLVYYSPFDGKVIYGGIEYDGKLDDYNILGSIHEVGKTQWIDGQLWLVRNAELVYRITVEKFVQFHKRWYEAFWD